MCANGSQPFDLVGEPLPEINTFFKNQKDGKIPSDLHRKLAVEDIKDYEENGYKILMMELLPVGWSQCQLQKLLGVRAYVSVLPLGG